jgi:AcrR family transcriptional regulator
MHFMTERRDELRDAALNYLLEHGVANVSLRPMAAKLGTSPRILMFHFKTKEGLLQEALGELHARLQASFVSIASADSGPSRAAPLKRFWQWATGREGFPYLRLLYEAQIIAIQNPVKYGPYLAKTSMDWLTISVRALSESSRTGPMATLCVAVFDGLFLELLSTGDRRRLTQALDHFIAIASPALRADSTNIPGVKGRSHRATKAHRRR